MRVEFFDHDGAASIVFVIDLSSSMKGEKWERLKAAMRKFLRITGSGSDYTLIGFSHQPWIMARSINSQQLLEIINTTTPDGSTALYDAVLLGFNVLSQITQRHKALVLFSDGEDHSSRATLEGVRKQALRHHVTIYTIGIIKEVSSFRRNGLTGKELLKDLALATGGSVHFPEPDGIKRVLEDISLDLNSRYSLSYYPTNKTTGWHTIKVSLKPRKRSNSAINNATW